MLAIAGGKGGVGKTTTALGLAAALSGRPLVVDADCDMPDLHALAGVPRSRSSDLEGPLDRVRYSTDHDCRVLPSPMGDPPRADRRLTVVRSWEARRDASSSPPILVDTPAGTGVDAAAPLRTADGVVLVSTACASALRDTAKTASMARAVGTPVVGAVLTRTSARPPNPADLLGCPLLGIVPESSGRPLEDRVVRDRYESIASAMCDVVESSEPRDACAELFSGGIE